VKPHAQPRCHTSTGISSDQYFNRGSYDPAASAEAQQRLAQFGGATAISSSAYFGRPEDDDADRGGDEGLLGDSESLAGLERGVRDLAGKVMANPEVQALGEGIRSGALKVSLALVYGVCIHPLRVADLSLRHSSSPITFNRCRNTDDEGGGLSLRFVKMHLLPLSHSMITHVLRFAVQMLCG
jgi:hypothetical protein